MATPRTRGDALGGMLVLLLLVLAIAGVLALVGLLLVLLYFEHRNLTRTTPTSTQFFANSAAETTELVEIQPVLKNNKDQLAALYRKARHLKRRRDGLFFETSNLAKKLNPEVGRLLRVIAKLEHRVREIKTGPQQRLKAWVDFKTTHLGLRTCLLTCAVGLLVLVLLQPRWVLFVSTFLDRFSVFGFMTETPGLTGSVLFVFLLCGLILALKRPLFGWWVRRQLRKGTAAGA